MRNNYPQIRILGMDRTGKSTLCHALELIDDQVITFANTPRYAYRWLETYGVGRAAEVTPQQVDIRQHVFGQMNEHESFLYNNLCQERPVVGVRGRADTYISANALRGKAMPRDIDSLFPKSLRPDALVVLTAPLWLVEHRIDSFAEKKTGANSLQYHSRTRQMYDDLAGIAGKVMPVLQFDTSQPINTPDAIARQVKLLMDDLKSL